jgi:serine/threonine-protein kinase HipA
LNGKKKNLTKNDFLKYFASDRLELNQKVIDDVLEDFKQAVPQWKELIRICFLSEEMKKKYLSLLDERCARLGL